MKPIFILLLCYLSLTLSSQEVIRGPWRLECGVSTNTAFKRSPSILNVRYISPRFKYSNQEWTDEMEKHPERYKKARFMIELMCSPPLKVLCTSINLQYRILKYKILSLEAYGGLKFILAGPPDLLPNYKVAATANKTGWYMNPGLIAQIDLGLIAPFADIGYDGLITVGTEFNFHAIYRKPKKRYKLHPHTNS